MFHIILLILKVIGTILLIILGLLLFLLLVVLLVPVRYQLRAAHGDNLYLKGRVSWLLHLVHVSVSHIEGVLHIQARLLGFVIYDNLRPPKPKKEKPERQARRKSKQAEKTTTLQQTISEPMTEKAQSQPLSVDQESNHQKTEIISDVMVKQPTAMENIKSLSKEDDTEKAEDNKKEDSKTEYSNTESTEERKSVFAKVYEKIRNILDKLKDTYRKVRNKLQSIRESIRNKIEKLKEVFLDIRHKWELIYDFWMDELNKQGMRYTFESVKKLLKHILPTKLKSELIIGTGDPYSTGQVLSVLSFFYGLYGDKVTILPDFENSRFEGKHFARGRIRAATVLIIAAKLLLDKRFKYLKKNFLILKEAL